MLYPSCPRWESVTTRFRKEYGFRYIFSFDEALKGGDPLDLDEVMTLRAKLMPDRITGNQGILSLN
jgi:hypothetical protein